MKADKRDKKKVKPQRHRYPHVISEDARGKVVAYSRNVVSYIPAGQEVGYA